MFLLSSPVPSSVPEETVWVGTDTHIPKEKQDRAPKGPLDDMTQALATRWISEIQSSLMGLVEAFQPSLLPWLRPLRGRSWDCVNVAAQVWLRKRAQAEPTASGSPRASFPPHLAAPASTFTHSPLRKTQTRDVAATDREREASYGNKLRKNSNQKTRCYEDHAFTISTLRWKPVSSLVLLIKSYSGIPQPISPTNSCLYFAGKLLLEAGLHKYLRSPVFSNAGHLSPI